MEQALLKIVSELKLLAEAMPQIVWICQSDGKNIYFNHQWVEYTGLTLEESYGDGWNKPFHPDDQQRAWNAWQNAVTKSGTYSLECRLRRADGEYFWWLIRGVPVLDKDGIVEKWFGTCTNIEELKKNETALRESEERYRTLVEQATDGIFLANSQKQFIDVNSFGCKMLGYSKEEVLNLKIKELHSPEDILRLESELSNLCTEKPAVSEWLFLRKDRSTFYGEIRGKTLKNGNYFALLTDITERKLIEQERIDQAKKLEEQSLHLIAMQENSRRRLSRELHERTSPNLAAIKINLDIISSTLSSLNATEISERIEDTQALITDTNNSIREVCSELRPPILEYAGLIKLLESYLPQFSRRTGIEVKFELKDRKWRGSQEAESILFQIIQEALTNCAKHSQAKSVTMKFCNEASLLSLTIIDNGIGFDQSFLGEQESIGLGIINMREMAKVAGGRFTIESAPNQGTRIFIDQFIL